MWLEECLPPVAVVVTVRLTGIAHVPLFLATVSMYGSARCCFEAAAISSCGMLAHCVARSVAMLCRQVTASLSCWFFALWRQRWLYRRLLQLFAAGNMGAWHSVAVCAHVAV
ncbi:hypothetical protein AVEN_141254-1 [Araneus ventricosus]|uniref:Uncharacterized protein n=1 Tax=Araneus ventricosus TaxID=182803 RepID=A0A4Y2WXY0_ARAVE|nr:hypothetical protein AVEN_141254-1 [Araneus ventricosus]